MEYFFKHSRPVIFADTHFSIRTKYTSGTGSWKLLSSARKMYGSLFMFDLVMFASHDFPPDSVTYHCMFSPEVIATGDQIKPK